MGIIILMNVGFSYHLFEFYLFDEKYDGMVNEFKEIFSKAKKNENVNNLLANFEHMIDSPDINNIVLSILFNFSTFDLIHRVIIDFLRNNAIEEKHITNLLNAL